jgi:hypothetical protein
LNYAEYLYVKLIKLPHYWVRENTVRIFKLYFTTLSDVAIWTGEDAIQSRIVHLDGDDEIETRLLCSEAFPIVFEVESFWLLLK